MFHVGPMRADGSSGALTEMDPTAGKPMGDGVIEAKFEACLKWTLDFTPHLMPEIVTFL